LFPPRLEHGATFWKVGISLQANFSLQATRVSLEALYVRFSFQEAGGVGFSLQEAGCEASTFRSNIEEG
jgi:hypothetical protein